MNLLEEKLESVVAIKNILFATDFSEVSEAALPYVTALSLRYGSTVHVAHVVPEATFVRPSPIDPALFGSIYEQAHSGDCVADKRRSGGRRVSVRPCRAPSRVMTDP